MKPKVLVIDDEPEILAMTETWLRREGYEPFTSEDGFQGLRGLHTYHPDLVLVDIVMPSMDGWEVCRRIREVCDTPVIIMSVNSAKDDLLRGFSLGIDDYITKPFEFPELVARIKAILRRAKGSWREDEPNSLHSGELDVDFRGHQVHVRGKPVVLSPTEFRVLACLVENRGWVVTHDQVLSSAWGPNYIGDKSYVKLYIRYLRQKIEEDPGKPRFILTERGVGYRFAG